MKTPRDIIAPIIYQKLLGQSIDQEPVHLIWRSGSFAMADAILAALTASGYRIVPAGRDPETIEACACVADMAHTMIVGPARDRETAFAVGEVVAAAIRTMGGGE